MKKTNHLQDMIYSGSLNAASVDEMSEAIVRTLEELGVEPKETARIRLSAESVMGIWAEELGEAASCRLIKKQRFGKPVVLLQVDGKSVDPTQYEDELLLSVSGNPNIAAALGMPAEYRYLNGRNILKLRLPIGATVLTFTDYACTACSVTCLQQSLLICAKKLGLLEHEWKKTEP